MPNATPLTERERASLHRLCALSPLRAGEYERAATLAGKLLHHSDKLPWFAIIQLGDLLRNAEAQAEAETEDSA